MRFTSKATSHLYISSPIPAQGKSAFGGKSIKKRISLFDTHPAPEERIKILRDMSV
jgi:Zn-dependent protease with chaperone function